MKIEKKYIPPLIKYYFSKIQYTLNATKKIEFSIFILNESNFISEHIATMFIFLQCFTLNISTQRVNAFVCIFL